MLPLYGTNLNVTECCFWGLRCWNHLCCNVSICSMSSFKPNRRDICKNSTSDISGNPNCMQLTICPWFPLISTGIRCVSLFEFNPSRSILSSYSIDMAFCASSSSYSDFTFKSSSREQDSHKSFCNDKHRYSFANLAEISHCKTFDDIFQIWPVSHFFLFYVCVVLIQFEGNSLICFVSKALTHSYFCFDSCAAAFKTPSWST